MAQARIFKPAKNAMQSGIATSKLWHLAYATATPRRPDPLMGWSSAADTLNEVTLKFETLEEAIAFARKNDLDYSVVEPQEPKFRPKSYADNFRWQQPR